jgi:hypothetical protein
VKGQLEDLGTNYLLENTTAKTLLLELVDVAVE